MGRWDDWDREGLNYSNNKYLKNEFTISHLAFSQQLMQRKKIEEQKIHLMKNKK